MGQRAGGFSDDGGITGIRFCLTWVQVGDAAHRQPGQIGDRNGLGLSDRDRQSADGGGLVDDDQECSVLGQPVKQTPEFRFVVRQSLRQQLFAVAVECDGVVVVFADIDADEYVDIGVVGDHVTHLLRLM